ncbi:MAG: DUF58 domain-containing protein [Acidimicrobiia bacterium]
MTNRSFGLTRRGWTVAGAAVGLLLGGRVLGADELSVLGLAVFGILAGATAWVALTRTAITVTRRLEPPRLHVGDAGRVDLAVEASRPTPLVDLTEPIDRDRLRARFLLAPLRPGTRAGPAYRVPTDRRGPLTLGPTTTVRTDPLGLARRRRAVAPAETVLVRPRVLPIAAPGLGAGRRLAADDTDAPRAPSADAGGEFLAVRPYEVGDDPRRVHWRSSARTGELMVRQFVAPRRGHTVVVLDTRAIAPAPAGADDGIADDDRTATSPAFERAVEATASIVSALLRARRPVECITTSGAVIARTGGDPQRTLDRLATVMMDEPDLLDAVARARRHQPPELVVLVTARMDERVHAARRLLARRSPALLVVTGGAEPDARTGGPVVDARTVAFADAWRAAHPTHRSRAAARSSLRNPPWNSAAPSRRPSPSPR